MNEQRDPTKTLYEGLCVGGPVDGRIVASRFPRGILVVDRSNDRCWIYDYDAGRFTVRETEGRPLNRDKRMYAALEDRDFDVLAVP